MVTKETVEAAFRKGIITYTEYKLKLLVLDGKLSQEDYNTLLESIYQEYVLKEQP